MVKEMQSNVLANSVIMYLYSHLKIAIAVLCMVFGHPLAIP